MAGLFDKIKKRAGLKGKAEAEFAEAELTKAKSVKNKKKEVKAEEKKAVEPSKSEEVRLAKVDKQKKQPFSCAYRILLRPVVSEKASVAESLNVYTFIVKSVSTKDDIKRAMVQVYGVKPSKVRIINNLGKSLRARNGMAKRSDWKKALVTLPAGQTIGVHEGV